MNSLIKAFREDARLLFQTGIQAADPAAAVRKHIQDRPDSVIIGTQHHAMRYTKPGFHIIAAGKAACAMAEASQKAISSDKILSALAVTSQNNLRPVDQFQVIAAGHPFPDEAGLEASHIVHERLSGLKADESVLLLLSGGASSLLPCPAAGISLVDKITTTRQLMESGASIHQLNCVRKHLSELKGGQMARLIAPHRCHTLILSDVPDNDLSVIASGPTYADETTFGDAISILHQQNIWDKVSGSVRHHLIKGRHQEIPDTPTKNDACFRFVKHTLIGDNRRCIEAVRKQAEKMSYRVIDYPHPVTGDCRSEAEKLVRWLKKHQTSLGSAKIALITGGETTVKVTGNGRGGRNQEMALSFALIAERRGLSGQWVFLSGGTDGIDGPTDAAGGMVDTGTLKRMDNALKRLNDNDSYTALKQSQDLLMTGATGTNVADIQVLLYQSEDLHDAHLTDPPQN